MLPWDVTMNISIALNHRQAKDYIRRRKKLRRKKLKFERRHCLLPKFAVRLSYNPCICQNGGIA